MGIDKDKSLLPAVAELRRQAEARLCAKNAERRPLRSEDAAQRLVHELEVHQIELEMQNGELLRALEELELSRNELKDKVALLEAVLVKVKHLEGIIPICMYCKKIRDDKESWQQLEGYITEHTDALFSHGICPECYRKATVEALKELDTIEER